MKVKELIDSLRRFDDEAEVVLTDNDDTYFIIEEIEVDEDIDGGYVIIHIEE